MQVKVRTRCQATLTEEWTLDISRTALNALLALDEDQRADEVLAWLDTGMVIGVENVETDNEEDREMVSYEVAAIAGA